MPSARFCALLPMLHLLSTSWLSAAGDLSTQNFNQAALRAGIRAENIGKPMQVRSDESIATVLAVRLVATDGTSHLGARLSLDDRGQVEDLYLPEDDVARLREEFAHFASWREADLQCDAITLCVQGVARCSPSEGTRQPVCPSMYSTPQGERGIIISTKERSFRFPSAHTSAFVAALDASLEQITALRRP